MVDLCRPCQYRRFPLILVLPVAFGDKPCLFQEKNKAGDKLCWYKGLCTERYCTKFSHPTCWFLDFPTKIGHFWQCKQAVTEYSGCRKDQPHIKLFWQALREFTPEERSMLVKFTWGRCVLACVLQNSQDFVLNKVPLC